MKKFIPVTLAILLLGGCAQLVEKRYGNSKGGTVKYTKELFMTEKNRTKALELANEYCSPRKPVIVSESDREEFTGVSNTSGETSGKHSYSTTTEQKQSTVYINFRCGKSKAIARR